MYKTGASLATLQHVLTGCRGLKEGGKVREAIGAALRDMEEAVPITGAESARHNRSYRKVVHEARTLLQAGDAADLSEQKWRRLEAVIAGCVPDFGRHAEARERRDMVRAVIAAVQTAQVEVMQAIEEWQEGQRKALERRRESERLREVLRTVCLAWREEADGRQAKGKAGQKGRGGDRGCMWLSGRGIPLKEGHPKMLVSQATTHISQVGGARKQGRDPYGEVFAKAGEVKYMCTFREEARSAVPPGSQARLLMTWARLTGGPEAARRRRDRKAWEGAPPSTERMERVRKVREEIARGGRGGEDGGRPISRVHTAERQGTEAMRRLFAQANAGQHGRGDRLAGMARAREGNAESVQAQGGRRHKYRRGWAGAPGEDERGCEEEEGADAWEERGKKGEDWAEGPGEDEMEWAEATGEGAGDEYEYEMDREMHWEAQAEWEGERETGEARGEEGATPAGDAGGGGGQ